MSLIIVSVLLFMAPVVPAGIPSNCKEVNNTVSGVDALRIPMNLVLAYCDMTTSGGGWTLIHRRTTGKLNFYRGWDEYVSGFGDPSEEFWWGLENIYYVTSSGQNYSLRVELTTFDGRTGYAEYSRFRVDRPETNYTLRVSGYSGTAGDNLDFHNNRPFSTYDKDNDASTQNCAAIFYGAWWYNSCHFSNLNGRYKASALEGPDGMTWVNFPIDKYFALAKAEMKIRPST